MKKSSVFAALMRSMEISSTAFSATAILLAAGCMQEDIVEPDVSADPPAAPDGQAEGDDAAHAELGGAIASPEAVEIGNLVDPAQPLVTMTSSAVSVTAGTATITGKVMFNDRRNHGLFSARRTSSGAVGTKCGTDGVFSDGTSCATHWLAGHYMVVDVFERDTGFGIFDVNCKDSDKIGSATVAYDGTFTATFSVDDPCNNDDWARTAITLQTRLKFCGSDWCFSLNSDNNTPYTLYYPGASYVSPLMVDAGDNVALATMAFHPAGTASDAVNNHSIAANLYASLVDTILTVHRDAGVPFYKDEFGELQYVYPSTQTATATALSPTKIVDRENTGWDGGLTPAHEYGHILMQRAWDGDYGFDGVGISAGDGAAAVSQQIAFKEAWAEFIAHAVFPSTNGCGLASFDDNANKPGTDPWGPLGSGTWWRLNVTKALCDWHDESFDDDPALAGGGDHFTADLYSLWFNLRRMYLDASLYGGDYSGDGLYFCDYVDYYLNVRKSAAAVGAAEHNAKVDSITDLVYNNNIACYLPAP